MAFRPFLEHGFWFSFQRCNDPVGIAEEDQDPKARRLYLHATAAVVGEAGVLIRGPSGSGKSSLAFALIAAAKASGLFARLIVVLAAPPEVPRYPEGAELETVLAGISLPILCLRQDAAAAALAFTVLADLRLRRLAP